MGNKQPGPAAKVVVEYKNKKPLDLLDLTASLTAFGEEYRRYAAQNFPEKANARLNVGVMRTGSIIAELIPAIQAADWVTDHTSLVAPFVGMYGDMLNLIRGFPPKARELERKSVRGAKDFVAPVAKDPGAEVHIFAQTGAVVISNVYNFGSNGSRTIRKNADIILGGLPNDIPFQEEAMILHQMRDGPAGTAGDYGFIDRFSTSPIKLKWSSEEVKSAILDRPENVFDMIYFVSGTVVTAGGRVAAFLIKRLDDVALKPAEDRHG